jgi:hypothetical protein
VRPNRPLPLMLQSAGARPSAGLRRDGIGGSTEA